MPADLVLGPNEVAWLQVAPGCQDPEQWPLAEQQEWEKIQGFPGS